MLYSKLNGTMKYLQFIAMSLYTARSKNINGYQCVTDRRQYGINAELRSLYANTHYSIVLLSEQRVHSLDANYQNERKS